MSMKDFKVVMSLGKGSYGSVYKVKRRSDGYNYAIKEVNITKLSSREREDAVNEIRVLASMNHTNIIRYCDAFVERDNLYIVMEFAERGDIYHKIKKYREANRCMREEVIWSYFIQMCRGIAELHSRRIMHRDIKPKNVFLTAKDHVRIGDLGCSKVMKQDLARTQIGTPYYMAPEIWSHAAYDEKCDVWALGCVLYEMCALRPPFLAKDMPELSSRVKSAPTPSIPRHFSSELQALVQMLLIKAPSARPSVSDILGMPCVTVRLHMLPRPDADDPFAAEAKPAKLLDTIRFPKKLPGRRFTLDLPEPSYPALRRRSLSPVAAKENRLSPRSHSSGPAPPAENTGTSGGGVGSKASGRIMSEYMDARRGSVGSVSTDAGVPRPKTSPTFVDAAHPLRAVAPSAPSGGCGAPRSKGVALRQAFHPNVNPAAPAPPPYDKKLAAPAAGPLARPIPPRDGRPSAGGIVNPAAPRRVTDLSMPQGQLAHHGGARPY